MQVECGGSGIVTDVPGNLIQIVQCGDQCVAAVSTCRGIEIVFSDVCQRETAVLGFKQAAEDLLRKPLSTLSRFPRGFAFRFLVCEVTKGSIMRCLPGQDPIGI